MTKEELLVLINENLTELFMLANAGQYAEAQGKQEELADEILEGFGNGV